MALFAAVVAAFASIIVTKGLPFVPLRHPLVAVLAGGAGMFALGLYDDLRPMRARVKLFTQAGIAAIVTFAGLQITDVYLPLFGTFHLAPWLAFILTMAWLVGVSNAFNLIDGLDGLAGGVAMFALGAFFLVAFLFGHSGAALAAAVLAGATLGFLIFNLPPASIFLGDSGSLFVGFMLAGLGIVSAQKVPGEVFIVIPIIILGLPILDTALTIVRRFLRLQPIFSPDRGHIHHRLLGRGHSGRNVMLMLYIACALFATAGAFFAYPADSVVLLVAMISILCFVGLALLIQRLGFIEFQELGRLARGAVNPRKTIGRNVRFREASSRFAELQHINEIFGALGDVFQEENIPRAEVRLQRWFVNRRPSVVTSDGRGDDELRVWSMNRSGDDIESRWEIVLPLISSDDRRMGSLVIWEEGQSYAESLSHLHVISEHLREALQHSLQMLDWPDAEELSRQAEGQDVKLEKAVGAENETVEAPRIRRFDRAASDGGFRSFFRGNRK